MPYEPSRNGCACDLRHPHPAVAGGRPLNRLAHRLNCRAPLEVRLPRAGRPALEQVAQMVDEARAVADALADGPPVACVRVALVLGPDPPHAIEGRVVRAIAEPQLVEPRVVE